MPKAPSLCLKCSRPALRAGRCEVHQVAPFEGARDRWKANRPSGWERLRRQVFRKFGGRCAACGQPGHEVDHIHPDAEGGVWALWNLQLLCRSCHQVKAQEEAARARHGKPAGVVRPNLIGRRLQRPE